MTRLTIVSPLITMGKKLELGDHKMDEITIRDVKCMIHDENQHIPSQTQTLWWRGYVLDDDSLTLTRACVGVNPGENVTTDTETLTLFLIIPEKNSNGGGGGATAVANRRSRDSRSNSFDLEYLRKEIRQQAMRKMEEARDKIHKCCVS
eukprot:CAMPEP_0172512108 /NCGR_PEP_ID=MMETSP1066-20121228/241752_1 /TAXON_ID=671091 /ORGANISM="Coscinodiscus wailesii, Strain CCMP2513" /LENGTH=148 /DNA_ID=CAMNT_0013291761 /DNA_START=44 /DNA_END=490 /DNA_ORIENTATION=+